MSRRDLRRAFDRKTIERIKSAINSCVVLGVMLLASCSAEQWTCRVDGKTMYSISSEGNLGSADKGCTCSEIRAFERKTFGEVDEDALRDDFGC